MVLETGNLKKALTKNEAKELTDLAPLRVFLTCKAAKMQRR